MLDKSVIWDHNLAQIRLFQAEVAKCLQEAAEGKTYSRMINMMVVDYTWLEGYITQYLDVLNVRFLAMTFLPKAEMKTNKNKTLRMFLLNYCTKHSF